MSQANHKLRSSAGNLVMKTPEELQKIAKVMQSAQELSEQAIKWMKTLPTASERCNQCACEGYRAGHKAAAPQWISVKDRLPPPKVTVLWWNETADQSGVSSYEYMSHCNDTMIEWGDAGYLSIKNFTHWMPLPKPPEEV